MNRTAFLGSFAVGIFSFLLFSAIVPATVFGAPHQTWYVDATATGNGNGLSAKNATTTIQAAINAASNGDTVDVAAGTYFSGFSVIGKNNLTIVGNRDGAGKDATIVEPSHLISTGLGHKYTQNMQVSVFVNNSSGLIIKSMRIEGNLQTPGSGGPDALVFWNNSSGTLQDLAVAGNGSIDGVQTGQGIAVDGLDSNLTVKGTDISGFQKNGMDIEDGNCYNNGNTCPTGPGNLSVNVQNGSITGTGPTGVIAQNGIVAWNEGNGTVTLNVNGTNFSSLDYTGNDTAAGILAFGAASIQTVSGASFKNVQQYIDSASSGKAVNATSGNIFDSVSPLSATTAQLGQIENKLNGEMETAGADPIFILPRTWIVTTANLGIQTALNDASNGDTVLVTPGSYSGNFNVSKSIIFDGAQFGKSVSGRTFNNANESTISGASNGTGVITITASGVLVDGFSITDVRPLFSALGIVVKSGGDNAILQNNIVNNISTADTGANDTAQAVYFEGPVNGVHVLNNLLSNISSKGSAKGILLGDNSQGDGSTNTLIQSNIISSVTSSAKGAYGISFGNTTNSQTGTKIKNNSISGLNGGGWVHGIGVEGNAPSIDIEGNTFSNFTSPAPIAIWFESEDTSFTTATVKDNNLAVGANQIGVGEQLTGGTVNAEQNWWGDQTGPTDTTSGDGSIPATNPHGIGSIAAGAVQYADWCTNAACTSFSNVTVPTPTPTSPSNGTITTTAGLTSVSWSSVTDAFMPMTYFYEVSNASSTNPDGSFTSPVYQSGVLTTNSIQTPNTPDGTYFWHVYAEDYLGNVSSWSTTSSFTINNTPSVTTDAANPVDSNDATLNATNGLFPATNTSFWWGTTSAGPFIAAADPSSELPSGWSHDSGLGASGVNSSFNESITGLVAGTTYYFAAWSQVGGVWYPGVVQSFTTTGTAPIPSATTDAATGVDLTDATLNGQNGAIAADQTSFWWGTTSASSFTSAADPSSELPSGWSHDSGLPGTGVGGLFNEPLTGLLPNTQYYFAAWSHVGGVWYPGSVLNFTTVAPIPPTPSVTTDAANPVSSSDATLNATNGPVDADAESFWVSLSPISTSSPSIPSGVYSTPVLSPVSANATFSDQLSLVTTNGVPSNLPVIQPNTTYYYVAWVEVGGNWYPGNEQSLTTDNGPAPVIPSVTTDGATNVSDADATLNGTIGAVDADNESFWVSTSSIDTSSSNIPSGVYSTPVLPGVSANGTFSDQLSLVTTQGITTGDVPANMPAITPSTTYYYVAWAEVGGTWYPGNQETVGTTATPPPPPVANPDTATTDINTPVTIEVLANDTNATNVQSVTQPTNGVVVDNGTDVTYTPDVDFSGTDSFTYVASSSVGTAVGNVTVTVVDTATPILTLNGANPSYVPTGTNTYNDLGVTITDPSSNNLGYVMSLDGGATTTPAAFTLDTSSAGTHTILYSATNSGGNTGTVSRTVIVLDPPTVTLTSTSSANTSDNPIQVVATFSEPVQDFTQNSVALGDASLNDFQISSTTEATFNVIPSGTGTVVVSVPQNQFENLAGTQNPAQASLTFNYTAPSSNNNNTPDNTGGGGGVISGPLSDVSTPIPGDINGDGKVNIVDLGLLLAEWGQKGSNLPADLNHDGVVNAADLAILLANWTH